MNLEVGKVYKLVHSRKGTFTGKVLCVYGEWADIEITKGRADAMLDYNIREAGEKVTVRVSHVTHAIEVKETK